MFAKPRLNDFRVLDEAVMRLISMRTYLRIRLLTVSTAEDTTQKASTEKSRIK